MRSGPRLDLHKPRQRACAYAVVHRKSCERLKAKRLLCDRRYGNGGSAAAGQAGLPEYPRARSRCTTL